LLTLITLAFAMAVLFVTTPAHASPQRLAIAKTYIGLKEGTKKADKAMGVNTRKTPWCGYFVKAVVVKTGKEPVEGYPAAKSWKTYGKAVTLKQAKPGDIVVVKNKRFHVGIFSHVKDGRVYLVGGNQSNSVKLSGYPVSRVKAVRR